LAIPATAAGNGLLLVRPTGVQICPADGAGHHLTGTVADVAFRGRGYDHAIDVPGQGRLTGVFSPARAGRGERVGLRFDPDGCHVFAPPEPGPADPGGPAGQATDGPGTTGQAAAAPAGPRVT
jgi:iron(III) transport system ATP-binding protein